MSVTGGGEPRASHEGVFIVLLEMFIFCGYKQEGERKTPNI